MSTSPVSITNVSGAYKNANRLVARCESPQQATLEATFVPGEWPGQGELVFWTQLAAGGPELPLALLSLAGVNAAEQSPALEEIGFFSRQIPLVLPLPPTPSGKAPRSPYGVVMMQGMAVSPLRALQLLAKYPLFPAGLASYGKLQRGRALEAFALAAKLALELAVGQRFTPALTSMARGRGTAAYWTVNLSRPQDMERIRTLATALPPPAHALAVGRHLQVWERSALLRAFLDAAIDALVRAAMQDSSKPLWLERTGLPERLSPQGWESRWLAGLTAPEPRRLPWDDVQHRHIPAEVDTWRRSGLGWAPDTLRLCLRLDPPGETPEETAEIEETVPENQFAGDTETAGQIAVSDGLWRLRYLVQAPDDLSLVVPVEHVWQAGFGEVKLGNRAFARPQELVLAALEVAARFFAPIEESLRQAAPTGVDLTQEEAGAFISDCLTPLEEAGIGIILPADLTVHGGRLRASLVTQNKPWESEGHFGQALLESYRWEVTLGNDIISVEEFRQIAALKMPLVRWRGRWLRVDPDQVASLDTFLRRRSRGQISSAEVLGTALGGDTLASELGVDVEVQLDDTLSRLLKVLQTEGFAPVPAPAGFAGQLRPYQERGVGWLAGLAAAGLGGCLADDMGLGKTVQVIAWLQHRRRQKHEEVHIDGDSQAAPARDATLIVCPTSLISNWRRELRRFAPELPVVLHYGPQRARSLSTFTAQLTAGIVVITSYQTARMDESLLGEVVWECAIIDEAQNIKNPDSKQTQCLHRLKAATRMALSGTPVENRLAELWSILNFTTPGLLGTFNSFQKKIALPVERFRDKRATQRLQCLVRPFVLRRAKTDPAIISDLPAKVEMTADCPLTREQASLYQAKVDETLNALPGLVGVQRAAKILGSLTALKQICNHPAHYLKERGPLEKRSGKLNRLNEILEIVLAAGESVLVFTQYAEMGRLLVSHIERWFANEVLFLHGQLPRTRRDEMIRRFQADDGATRVFILSLKAGGTGLNLTQASCVIHYDRWWNPAVEDQATDRAYRIGQTRQVQVHKFVCTGTLEEKIDMVLAQKRDLAQTALGQASDKWITQLSDDELRNLLSLDREAFVSEGDDE